VVAKFTLTNGRVIRIQTRLSSKQIQNLYRNADKLVVFADVGATVEKKYVAALEIEND